MPQTPFHPVRRWWLGPALAVLAAAATPAPASAETLTEMLGLGQPPAPTEPIQHVAQSRQQLGQLLVEIQQLQEQVRTLTGRVDGLQFQVTQMQAQLQKQQGGAATTPPATPPTSYSGAAAKSAAPAGGTDWSATDNDAIPADRLGRSNDPLVGTNAPPGATAPLAPGAAPLDLSLPKKSSNPDAQAVLKAGHDAVTSGDYAFAADQFRQFLSLYPDDPEAAEATRWLGEALVRQGEYGEAAQVLVDGFKKYRETAEGADILLELGIALVGADETPAACKTFAEAGRRYPDASPEFRKRLAEETAQAKCAAG